MRFKLSLFLKELVLFGAVQILGLYVARIIAKQPAFYGISREGLSFSWPDLLFIVIFGFIFVMLARRHSKIGGVLFKVVFILAIFSGTNIVASVFLDFGIALLVALFLVLLTLFFSRVWVHNLAMVLALAGIGAVFGLSLKPVEAVILLALLSFYDIWAVYKTKHMVQLAEGMIRAGAISGVIIPPSHKELFSHTRSVVPGSDSMILGSGDIIFPLVLSASVLAATSSLIYAILVTIFSCLGLFLMHLLFVSQTERKPMAALPPIATASIVGYLVTLIFNF